MQIIEKNEAKVSEIARHWGLTREATQKLLAGSGAKPSSRRPLSYDWRDVWQVEGAAFVQDRDVRKFKAPLLKPDEVRAAYLPMLSLRAIRDQAQKRSLPGIKLSTEWRFREADILDHLAHRQGGW